MAIKVDGDPLGRDQAPVKPEKPVKPQKAAQKKRTPAASPKVEAPAAVKPEAPKSAPVVGRGPGRPKGPDRVPMLVKVPPDMVSRLEWAKTNGGFDSRNDTIVALLEKALT